MFICIICLYICVYVLINARRSKACIIGIRIIDREAYEGMLNCSSWNYKRAMYCANLTQLSDKSMFDKYSSHAMKYQILGPG